MILLNKGLTSAEKAKVRSPYAANCGHDSYDLEKAGQQVAAFIDRNEDAFKEALKLLDRAHSHSAETK